MNRNTHFHRMFVGPPIFVYIDGHLLLENRQIVIDINDIGTLKVFYVITRHVCATPKSVSDNAYLRSGVATSCLKCVARIIII